MHQKLSHFIYIILLVLLPALTLGAPPSVNWQTEMRDLIYQWQTEKAMPATTVSIKFLNDPKIYNFYSGTVMLNSFQDVTSHHLFQLGSVTKTYISAVLLQLEAEGKLTIDSPIGQWFPEYPRWSKITVKQLLNMTSGIYNFTKMIDLMKMSPADRLKQWQPNELVNVAYEHTDYFPPGKAWQYSNTNYVLAGMIIERVTNQPLATVLQERLLSKLHLTHTYFLPYPYPDTILQRMVRGYRDKVDITQFNMSSYGAAGAMIANSEDVIHWTNALFNGTVLKPQQLTEFMTTVPFQDQPPKPAGSRYGLGIYLTNIPQLGDVWWYSGVTDGYISMLAWIPNKKTFIAANIDHRVGNQYGTLMPEQALFDEIIMVLKKNVWH
ncbi:MAG: serine hydrolase [Gammaproteobacteria bacterium]|nr:serine hydrolase [Gammaproteobacteria bacterium]